jgi:hypothetical protein
MTELNRWAERQIRQKEANKMIKNKVLFQLYIDPEQLEYLIQQSAKTGQSRASLVRQLIQKEINKQKKAEARAKNK